MSEDTSAVSSVKIKKTRWEYLSEWFRSPAFKSIVMWIITFLVILLLFFVVCIPQKYDLSVGRTSMQQKMLWTKSVRRKNGKRLLHR